eukprot:scaffold3051_cov167-Ochromonas_danica.AAC.33
MKDSHGVTILRASDQITHVSYLLPITPIRLQTSRLKCLAAAITQLHKSGSTSSQLTLAKDINWHYKYMYAYKQCMQSNQLSCEKHSIP